MSLRSTAFAMLSLPLLALVSSGQTMPLALAGPGSQTSFNLWTYDELSGSVSPGPQAVTFLSLKLAGYASVDRLRLDRPALVGGIDAPDYVRLPGGGSLYRVSVSGGTALLSWHPDGAWYLPLVVPDNVDGEPGLQQAVHVNVDGSHALLATEFSQGGNVILIDLQGSAAPVDLTAALPPLSIADESLRLSSGGAWFVADNNLLRVDLTAGTGAEIVDLSGLGLVEDFVVQPELALAAYADTVAFVGGDDESAFQVLTLTVAGEPILITETADSYDLPNYEHELAPWLAVSPDGSLVAYRKTNGSSLELFVRESDASLAAIHITSAPDFPVYIDIIGVLSFSLDRILCFFSGDLFLSGLASADTIGAGEMYAADLTTPGQAAYYNVSLTNGQTAPPFTAESTLYFSEVVFDPMGMSFIMSGPLPDNRELLSTFKVYPVQSGTGVSTLLTAIDDQPELFLLGEQVLVTSKPDEGVVPLPAGADDPGLDVGLLVTGSGSTLTLAPLVAVPQGIELDRFTFDPNGEWLGLVASVAPGLELPVLLHLATGMPVMPTWPLLLEVSPAIAFSSSGNLYVGLGGQGGPYKFAGLPTGGGSPHVVPMPLAYGFPLGH
jgi:hypothetical protein